MRKEESRRNRFIEHSLPLIWFTSTFDQTKKRLHTCQLSRFWRESPTFFIKSPGLPVRPPNLPVKSYRALFFINVVACVAGVIVGSRLVKFWATAKPRGEWGGGHKGMKQWTVPLFPPPPPPPMKPQILPRCHAPRRLVLCPWRFLDVSRFVYSGGWQVWDYVQEPCENHFCSLLLFEVREINRFLEIYHRDPQKILRASRNSRYSKLEPRTSILDSR